MSEYDVEVTRTAAETKTFRVMAEDAEAAKDKAVEAAANTVFNNPGCPTYEALLPYRVLGHQK